MSNIFRTGFGRWRFRVVASVFVAIFSTAALAEDCQLKRIASLDASVSAYPFVTNAELEGKPVRVMIDTGTDYNVISEKDAQRLGLTIQQVGELVPPMFLGFEVRNTARNNKIRLGSTSFAGLPLILADDRLIDRSKYDMILGAQFLSNFDLDLDLNFKRHKIDLFSPDHCEGKAVYWTQKYLETPVRIDRFGLIHFEVELDGQKLNAMLDTGAVHSVLNEAVAQRLFSIPASPDRVQVTVAGAAIPVFSHPFKRLAIDGLALRDPEIYIGTPPATNKLYLAGGRFDSTSEKDPDLVLGLNTLQFLHLYVATKEQKLYFSPAVD